MDFASDMLVNKPKIEASCISAAIISRYRLDSKPIYIVRRFKYSFEQRVLKTQVKCFVIVKPCKIIYQNGSDFVRTFGHVLKFKNVSQFLKVA